jgi:hypothetical protein
MCHKTLFLLSILLLSGYAAPPKTEVKKAPPSEKVVFYSDSGKEKEIGCVNTYRLITQSLAAKEDEKISKGLITKGTYLIPLRKNCQQENISLSLKILFLFTHASHHLWDTAMYSIRT